MSTGIPIPSFIFRGHISAIHALHFFASNTYLASGDSDGWIVVWSLSTKRAVAAWKGHEGSVMGLKDWQDERLISHGRDHKLRVWQMKSTDMENLGKELPVEGANPQAAQPWLIHSIDVNALNFCAFSTCHDVNTTTDEGFKSLLLASPNGLDHGQVDIFQLPSERRVSKTTIMEDSAMIMTVSLFFKDKLTLVSGHEDGTISVIARKDPVTTPVWIWEKLFISTPHKQPVLSIDITPDLTSFISSGADAIIYKHRIPTEFGEDNAGKIIDTKHAGQQDLRIRSDGKIFATAGWDKMIRVYSVKTLKEMAVLKWHQQGCYSIDFAKIFTDTQPQETPSTTLEKYQQDRAVKAQNTHWIVAGGKDGKISLWNIY